MKTNMPKKKTEIKSAEDILNSAILVDGGDIVIKKLNEDTALKAIKKAQVNAVEATLDAAAEEAKNIQRKDSRKYVSAKAIKALKDELINKIL